MELVQPVPRYYLVYLKMESQQQKPIKIRANCFTVTEYNTYAFYLEDIDFVNKAYLKTCPPAPVFEIPRKDVFCVAEEGLSDFELPKPIPKLLQKKTKTVLGKSDQKKCSRKKKEIR